MIWRITKECFLPVLLGVLPFLVLVMLIMPGATSLQLGESYAMALTLLGWAGTTIVGGFVAGFFLTRLVSGRWLYLQVVPATPQAYMFLYLYLAPRDDWPTAEALTLNLSVAVVSLACVIGGAILSRGIRRAKTGIPHAP